MEEREVTEVPEEAAVPATAMVEDESGGQPDSLLGALREKRREISENKETFITIPGYDSGPPVLMANYRLVEGPEIDRIARKVRQETRDNWQRQVLAAVDLLIAACQGMYVDLDDGNGPVPMTLKGDPIPGFTNELAIALEFDAQTARQVLFGLFADNDVAIMSHSARLGAWMSDTSRNVDEDFLGEV